MQIKKEMILREVAGETILVPGADAVLDFNGLFIVTETGSFIWSLLPEVETEDEILEKMLKEYDVDKETAQQDIKEFLDKLRELGILD